VCYTRIARENVILRVTVIVVSQEQALSPRLSGEAKHEMWFFSHGKGDRRHPASCLQASNVDGHLVPAPTQAEGDVIDVAGSAVPAAPR